MTTEELNDALQLLDLSMPETDIGPCTVRHYLYTLLKTLWHEKEGFDGKRPFGNSDWDSCIAVAAVQAGLVAGTVSEEALWVDSLAWPSFERLVSDAIQVMCGVEDGKAP